VCRRDMVEFNWAHTPKSAAVKHARSERQRKHKQAPVSDKNEQIDRRTELGATVTRQQNVASLHVLDTTTKPKSVGEHGTNSGYKIVLRDGCAGSRAGTGIPRGQTRKCGRCAVPSTGLGRLSSSPQLSRRYSTPSQSNHCQSRNNDEFKGKPA
jgi:hypothetical protein